MLGGKLPHGADSFRVPSVAEPVVIELRHIGNNAGVIVDQRGWSFVVLKSLGRNVNSRYDESVDRSREEVVKTGGKKDERSKHRMKQWEASAMAYIHPAMGG